MRMSPINDRLGMGEPVPSVPDNLPPLPDVLEFPLPCLDNKLPGIMWPDKELSAHNMTCAMSAQDGGENSKSKAAGIAKPHKSKSVTLPDLKRVFSLPRGQAASKLSMSVNCLKLLCRRLGIERWPHRKLASLDALAETCRQAATAAAADGLGSSSTAGTTSEHDGLQARLAAIASERSRVLQDPNHEIDAHVLQLRTSTYKQRYVSRRREGAVGRRVRRATTTSGRESGKTADADAGASSEEAESSSESDMQQAVQAVQAAQEHAAARAPARAVQRTSTTSSLAGSSGGVVPSTTAGPAAADVVHAAAATALGRRVTSSSEGHMSPAACSTDPSATHPSPAPPVAPAQHTILAAGQQLHRSTSAAFLASFAHGKATRGAAPAPGLPPVAPRQRPPVLQPAAANGAAAASFGAAWAQQAAGAQHVQTAWPESSSCHGHSAVVAGGGGGCNPDEPLSVALDIRAAHAALGASRGDGPRPSTAAPAPTTLRASAGAVGVSARGPAAAAAQLMTACMSAPADVPAGHVGVQGSTHLSRRLVLGQRLTGQDMAALPTRVPGDVHSPGDALLHSGRAAPVLIAGAGQLQQALQQQGGLARDGLNGCERMLHWVRLADSHSSMASSPGAAVGGHLAAEQAASNAGASWGEIPSDLAAEVGLPVPALVPASCPAVVHAHSASATRVHNGRACSMSSINGGQQGALAAAAAVASAPAACQYPAQLLHPLDDGPYTPDMSTSMGGLVAPTADRLCISGPPCALAAAGQLPGGWHAPWPHAHVPAPAMAASRWSGPALSGHRSPGPLDVCLAAAWHGSGLGAASAASDDGAAGASWWPAPAARIDQPYMAQHWQQQQQQPQQLGATPHILSGHSAYEQQQLGHAPHQQEYHLQAGAQAAPTAAPLFAGANGRLHQGGYSGHTDEDDQMLRFLCDAMAVEPPAAAETGGPQRRGPMSWDLELMQL